MNATERAGNTGREQQSGFAYLMLAVVLAAAGLLLVAALPVADGQVDLRRRAGVREQLQAIRSALELYCTDHARFPASLTAPDFFAVHLSPGLANSAAADAWSNSGLRYLVDQTAHTATVYSLDADCIDQGAANEDLVAVADGAAAAQGKTRQRLALATAVAQQFVAAGGTLTGDWRLDRPALGLGAEFADDALGAPLQPVYAPGGDEEDAPADDGDDGGSPVDGLPPARRPA